MLKKQKFNFNLYLIDTYLFINMAKFCVEPQSKWKLFKSNHP